MKTRNLMLLTASLFLLVVGASQAWAADRGYTMPDRIAAWHASQMSWHDNYQHWQLGRPVPLVVPPTARASTEYNWGVSRNTMTPIYHQFGRNFPGEGYPGMESGLIQPAPHWPASTRQGGVYYIRGPW